MKGVARHALEALASQWEPFAKFSRPGFASSNIPVSQLQILSCVCLTDLPHPGSLSGAPPRLWLRRERKKLKVHANEGQCDNVAEMFMACSYSIDGDYMFGVTVAPIARVLEALKVAFPPRCRLLAACAR